MSLKPEFIAAAEALPKVVYENGVAVNFQETVDAALASQGIKQDELKQTHKSVGHALALAGYCAGAGAAEAFQADPSLERVTATAVAGADEFDTTYKRRSVNRDPSTGDEVVNHLTSQFAYVATAGRNLGEHKQVRNHFKQLGKELFGDKK